LRDRSIGWDGEIAAYANKRHRRIFDGKDYYCLLIEAGGIALAILGGCNDQIRDNRRHGRAEISKRLAGLVESLAHSQGRGVVEPNVLAWNEKYRAGAQERSQSPRLEAVSVMAESVPLMVSRLIKTVHFWMAR
jgi:hypothetical protein